MTTYNLLQNYWWLIMSVLGALLNPTNVPCSSIRWVASGN